MEIKEIQNLIKFVAKSGAHEVKLETENFKITIKANSSNSTIEHKTIIQDIPNAPNPSYQTQQEIVPSKNLQPSGKTEVFDRNEVSEAESLITIKSPMIGTFYRKPSPDKKVFVEVGEIIKEGDVLCVVEAMKLFNEIESEVNGKIVKILVDDSSPVEFDQPLFLVEPV